MIKKIFSVTTTKGKLLVALATLAFTLSGLLGAYLMVIVVDLLSNAALYQNGAPLGPVWLAGRCGGQGTVSGGCGHGKAFCRV